MRIWTALCVVIVLATLPSSSFAEEPTSFLIFDSGKEGYPRYRIPSLLVTPKGTVLAICEGRKDGRGLTGNIDIVLKRSSDSGKAWGPLEVVADDGPHTIGNPCAVVDPKDGTIWMALTRSHGMDTEDEITDGKSRETTKVLMTHSRDDGKTWAVPTDITKDVRSDDWTWYGTGPGIGIALKNGRLVMPSYHAEKGTKIYRSHMIYSDDHGKTWKRGETVDAECSECQAAERADGSLFLSSRTIKGGHRTIATSTDGGEKWSAGIDKNIYDSACQASLYRLPGEEKPRWLYCYPAGPGRRDLTVRLSVDEGKTWPTAKLLRKGDSQYSSLAKMPDGAIGCLHESWVDGNYRMYFVRFTMDWLVGK
ncbi:MAG: glycoside hydrolase [Planctomycetes bacterium]|nr:glycoside hydrolase [Planctomycetota bacterium]